VTARSGGDSHPEWTDDWWTDHHPESTERLLLRRSGCRPPRSPRGASSGSLDRSQPQFAIPRKVVKGGSHLDADTYCLRYRPTARRPQSIDTGMSHIGFRCAWPADAAGLPRT
jgi:formylglycine-generating enzyme